MKVGSTSFPYTSRQQQGDALTLKSRRRHLRKVLITAFVLFSAFASFSQQHLAPYQQNKQLPSFKIQTSGKGVFSSNQLKKNTPVIIMFFSPGCDHCINQFNDMVKRMNDLKHYQIVMATYQPIEELAGFNKKYNIAKYPNIITGRDADYFLPPFFEISNFPHFAFYNKQGKLIGTYEGNLSVNNILAKFK